MGLFVSTVQPSENEEVRRENTMHALAIDGNEDGLKTFLEANPTADVNEKDEYVGVLRVFL